MKREELKAEALIDLGSEPAPKEWENIPCIKEQRPPIVGFEASLQRFTGTDICTWFICVGGLWQPHSDYFQVSLPPAEGAEQRIRVRNILQDFYRRGEYELEQAEEDIMRLFQPQPTAEGAEEILLKHCKENKVFLTSNELHTILDAMQDFATLHAQRIADKMVEEKAVGFADWLSKLQPSQKVSVWSKNGEHSGLFTMDNEQLYKKYLKSIKP